jgi:hypothetical protein
MSVFEKCKGAAETWHAFYTVACLCDQPADMQALCGQARHALGADWPWDAATEPLPYDIFCKMGDACDAVGDKAAGNSQLEEVRGYDPASYAPYSSIDWGRVELVGRAAVQLSRVAPPVA